MVTVDEIRGFIAKGEAMLRDHGIEGWTVAIARLDDVFGEAARHDLGYCRDRDRTVWLERRGIRRHFRQTMLHEIAHILTPDDQDHGDAWMEKASSIGCTLCHIFPYVLRLDASLAQRRE